MQSLKSVPKFQNCMIDIETVAGKADKSEMKWQNIDSNSEMERSHLTKYKKHKCKRTLIILIDIFLN